MLHLAADGGGTKLAALVCDDELTLVSSAKTGGTNYNFKSCDLIMSDTDEMLTRLLGPVFESGADHLDSADACIVGDTELFLKQLQRHIKVDKCSGVGESNSMLAAGRMEPYGVLALSGTGSDIYWCPPPDLGKNDDVIGGWGDLLGDEGSGCDIGQKTLRAAIWSHDGRGPKSLIEELLIERWKLTSLNGLIALYHDPERRSKIASATYVTEEAAAAGDEVALGIYREAGHQMAIMTNTLLARHGGALRGSILASGGAWKGCPAMFDEFKAEVLARWPDAVISRPGFEPIIGGIVLRRLYSDGKTPTEEEKSELSARLAEKLPQYKYKFRE